MNVPSQPEVFLAVAPVIDKFLHPDHNSQQQRETLFNIGFVMCGFAAAQFTAIDGRNLPQDTGIKLALHLVHTAQEWLRLYVPNENN